MSTTRRTSTQGATTNHTDLPPTPQTQDAPSGKGTIHPICEEWGMRITLALLAGKVASIPNLHHRARLRIDAFSLATLHSPGRVDGRMARLIPSLDILIASAVSILNISMVHFPRKRLIFPPLFQQMSTSLLVDSQHGAKTREKPTADELMGRDQELKATLDALTERLASELGTPLRYIPLGTVQRASQAMRDKLKGKNPSKGDTP